LNRSCLMKQNPFQQNFSAANLSGLAQDYDSGDV
jgi:hypothetical protein